MSKDTKNLVEQSLGLSAVPVEEVSIQHLHVDIPLSSCPGFSRFTSRFTSVCSPQGSLDYSPSKTDQLHALSVADMVKVGQASAGEIEQDAYDLKPGQHVSKGDFAQPLSDTDWADPAQIFESEQEILRTAERRRNDDSLEVPDAKERQERGERESSAGEKSPAEESAEK